MKSARQFGSSWNCQKQSQPAICIGSVPGCFAWPTSGNRQNASNGSCTGWESWLWPFFSVSCSPQMMISGWHSTTVSLRTMMISEELWVELRKFIWSSNNFCHNGFACLISNIICVAILLPKSIIHASLSQNLTNFTLRNLFVLSMRIKTHAVFIF